MKDTNNRIFDNNIDEVNESLPSSLHSAGRKLDRKGTINM
jgi:hypothetical protein